MADLMRAKDILGVIKRHKKNTVPGNARTRLEKGYIMAHDHITELICRAVPTVDAVEVVRCKDCKKYRKKFFPNGESYGWYCSETHYGRKPDDFCSYGERREPSNEP